MCVWLVCVTTFQRERERDSEGYIPLFGARILITFKLLITRKERRGRNGYRAVFLQVSSFLERETERKDASQTDTRFLQKLVMIPLGEKKDKECYAGICDSPLFSLGQNVSVKDTKLYKTAVTLISAAGHFPVSLSSFSLIRICNDRFSVNVLQQEQQQVMYTQEKTHETYNQRKSGKKSHDWSCPRLNKNRGPRLTIKE